MGVMGFLLSMGDYTNNMCLLLDEYNFRKRNLLIISQTIKITNIDRGCKLEPG